MHISRVFIKFEDGNKVSVPRDIFLEALNLTIINKVCSMLLSVYVTCG